MEEEIRNMTLNDVERKRDIADMADMVDSTSSSSKAERANIASESTTKESASTVTVSMKENVSNPSAEPAFQILTDLSLGGRILVATRDLKYNDLVLTETPFLVAEDRADDEDDEDEDDEGSDSESESVVVEHDEGDEEANVDDNMADGGRFALDIVKQFEGLDDENRVRFLRIYHEGGNDEEEDEANCNGNSKKNGHCSSTNNAKKNLLESLSDSSAFSQLSEQQILWAKKVWKADRDLAVNAARLVREGIEKVREEMRAGKAEGGEKKEGEEKGEEEKGEEEKGEEKKEGEKEESESTTDNAQVEVDWLASLGMGGDSEGAGAGEKEDDNDKNKSEGAPAADDWLASLGLGGEAEKADAEETEQTEETSESQKPSEKKLSKGTVIPLLAKIFSVWDLNAYSVPAVAVQIAEVRNANEETRETSTSNCTDGDNCIGKGKNQAKGKETKESSKDSDGQNLTEGEKLLQQNEQEQQALKAKAKAEAEAIAGHSAATHRALFPYIALIPHSCIPNVRIDTSNGGVGMVRTTRSVKKGDVISSFYPEAGEV
jgi:hypothetical protein